jgi:hypothetical protein
MYPFKAMHNFVFRGIVIDNSGLDKNSCFFLTGMPGHYIEDIILTDIQMTVSGGGTVEDAEKTGHKEFTLEVMDGWWPEFYRVGTLPAHAIYARHMKNLFIDNFHVKKVTSDARPAIVFKDVINGQIHNVWSEGTELSESDIEMR